MTTTTPRTMPISEEWTWRKLYCWWSIQLDGALYVASDPEAECGERTAARAYASACVRRLMRAGRMLLIHVAKTDPIEAAELRATIQYGQRMLDSGMKFSVQQGTSPIPASEVPPAVAVTGV